MGALTRLWERFARTAPAVTGDGHVARLQPTWRQGKPLPPPHDYRAFAEDGYRRNIIIAACLWEITASATEPELQVLRVNAKGEETPEPGHDLAGLLKYPNPDQDQDDFLQQLITHQHIGAQWYVHKIRGGRRNVVELWALRPDRTRIIPGARGLIEGYEFTPMGASTPAPLITRDDAFLCKLHADFLDDYYGLSPLAAVARVADLDNQAIDWLRAFFYNGGSPAGMLKFKTRKDAADRERARALFKERYGKRSSGEVGWHDVLVADEDVDYQEIGIGPGKLNLDAIFDETETRICMAFGVPPIVIAARIGLLRSTFANYKEARTAFWDEKMLPLLRRTAAKLTWGVAREFGPDLIIRFDVSHVAALQEDVQQRREFAVLAYQAGLLTLDQALMHCGLPSLGGDEGSRRLTPAQGSSLTDLFGPGAFARARGRERHAFTQDQRRAQTGLKRLLAEHFRAQGDALAAHLREGIAALDTERE